MQKPVFYQYRPLRAGSRRQHYFYHMLFAALVIFLFFCQEASAITPGLTDQAGYGQEKLARIIGTREYSDLRQLVSGLRAFGRQDYPLAVQLLTPLANKGLSEAQFYMGLMCDAGLGVKKDVTQAYLWYRAAAMGGHPNAQHNLAVAYAQGEGVEANPAKAIYWWQRAAKQGNTDAQYNLGIVYAVGKLGVEKNLQTAKMWWQKAALQGDGMAQYNLGILYANGKGAQKSYCEATRWWQKSIANGVAQAGVALEVLKRRKDYRRCW